MEVLGVEFAPLNTPLKRRLQTLAAAAYFVILVCGGLIGYLMTAYILFYTTTVRYLMIPYLMWVYYDRETCENGGRGEYWTRWMRNHTWWRYLSSYFPLKLVKTADLDPSRNYLLCCFPHGVLCTGCFAAFATDALGVKDLFPGLVFRMLTLRQHFGVPFFREFVYSFGSCSSSAKSIDTLMSTPNPKTAIALAVGGAVESLECKPGTYRIVLNRRKGFIRLALKHGTPLVPVFAFGETDLYNQINNPEGSVLRKIQEFIKDVTGLAPVLMIGRGIFQYSFGVIPRRKPVTVVVGAPMEIPKIPEPTREEVDDYHAKFTKNLVNFFEEHKHNYVQDAENTNLVIE